MYEERPAAMIVIDKICYHSNLRYVNACEKTAFAVFTLLICVISRSTVIAGIVLAALGFLTVLKGGTPFFRYLKLLTIPLAFLAMSTIAIILNFSSTPLDAFAIPLGTFYITSSYSSLSFGIQLIATALASVSCLYFLALSTPVPDFLMTLRKIHVPELMIELMLLIYRFIFVLMDLSSSINTAQDSRLGNRNFRTSCKSFGALCSVLLVRAFQKSNRLYDAMESRCYDGKIQVLTEECPVKKNEVAWIVVFELLLIVIWLFWGDALL